MRTCTLSHDAATRSRYEQQPCSSFQTSRNNSPFIVKRAAIVSLQQKLLGGYVFGMPHQKMKAERHARALSNYPDNWLRNRLRCIHRWVWFELVRVYPGRLTPLSAYSCKLGKEMSPTRMRRNRQIGDIARWPAVPGTQDC